MGVLALAGGGTALALLLPGNGGGPAGTPTGTGTAGTASTTAVGYGAVPAALVGRWRGDITTSLVPLSSTFELTVRQGGEGAVVTESRNNSHLTQGAYCLGRGTLVSADADSIVVREGPAGGNTDCVSTPETQTYRLNPDGTLHLEIVDAAGTNPSGDLAKQG